MKKNGLLVVMFGMALIFGVVLPQNVKAADEAGMQKLESYYKDKFLQGKKPSKEEFDNIVQIIKTDGKVDEAEYTYICQVLEADGISGRQILSGGRREIIQALHDDYVRYNADVAKKYPELIDLDIKLPLDLRELINGVALSNILIEERLSEDQELNERTKKNYARDMKCNKDCLKELQDVLPTSPYKEILTKIYDAETKLLEENLKKFSERQ